MTSLIIVIYMAFRSFEAVQIQIYWLNLQQRVNELIFVQISKLTTTMYILWKKRGEQNKKSTQTFLEQKP